MERKTHWEAIWTASDPTAVSWYQAGSTLSLELIARTGLSPASPIIDVGGGASTLVDHLLDQGYTDVTVLDIAEAAIERARVRLGQRADAVTWLVADVTSADLPPAYYAVWHDRAVFHFLTDPADRQAYVTVLRRALAPGGYWIVATFAPDGPTHCSGLEVVRYAPDDLCREVGSGFHLVESRSEMHITPSGGRQSFVYCLFQKD